MDFDLAFLLLGAIQIYIKTTGFFVIQVVDNGLRMYFYLSQLLTMSYQYSPESLSREFLRLMASILRRNQRYSDCGILIDANL